MVYKSGQIFLPYCFVTIHACDRRTDRQTDRILIARPRLHSMQRGKNQPLFVWRDRLRPVICFALNWFDVLCHVANTTHKGRVDVDGSCVLCTGHQSWLQGLLQLLQWWQHYSLGLAQSVTSQVWHLSLCLAIQPSGISVNESIFVYIVLMNQAPLNLWTWWHYIN